MIPRIAHFHWEGPPMGWLRMMGIWSFIRLNPRWEVRLHRTPDKIRKLKLPCYGNEADWTWLEMVHKHGGFALATDTVFVKPMPEEWLDADFCGCFLNDERLWHCCFGAKRRNKFIKACFDHCSNSLKAEMGYEHLGIKLLNRVFQKDRDSVLRCNLSRMSDSAITPVGYYEVERCWEGGELDLPDDTVGVTWFGANKLSLIYEYKADSGDFPITKLARKVLS